MSTLEVYLMSNPVYNIYIYIYIYMICKRTVCR